MGDVSYSMPDSHGYSNAFYWRLSFFGTKGIAETAYNADGVTLLLNGEKTARQESLPEPNPGGYFKSFVNDIAGRVEGEDLDTQSVLETARISLLVQKAADKKLCNQPL